MQKTGKLELTWVGKEYNSTIEPRILIEDKEKSYGNPNNDNLLIHGDNLIALKALEQKYFERIKCIFIDPPFNTGAAFEHYDDCMEHSIWLNLMYKRIKILHDLLKDDGCIFINLDDSESAYCKILMDEIFGRKNYLNEIIVGTNKSFGFKSTSNGLFKQANHILLYSKNKDKFMMNVEKLYIEKGYDPQYKWEFYDTDKPEKEWKWRNINDVVAQQMGYSSVSKAKENSEFLINVSNYALSNAKRVFRTASVSGGALLKRKETINMSKNNKNMIFRHPNDDMDYMFIGGERVIPYEDRLKYVDGYLVPAELITDIWMDISVEGLAAEGGVDFPKGKKPEKLIKRCLELTTNPGDYVLDSFLGSGTTAAVAHKMGRRWIGIELGKQVYTHCKVRLDSVIDGEQSGISKLLNWRGGGGYHFYELAPSLIVQNTRIGSLKQINPDYSFEMVCEAICKIEGFLYKPFNNMQGYSSEKRFIHITREFVNNEYVNSILSTINNDESVLIYCYKMQKDIIIPENVEIRKMPNDLIKKCDYESEVR